MIISIFQFPVSIGHAFERTNDTNKYIIYPDIDTFVHESNANQSYEEEEKLIIGNGREGIFQFSLDEIQSDEVVVGATLNLYKLDTNTNMLQIQTIDHNEWERPITYHNRPNVNGDIINSFTVSGRNTFVKADITEGVQKQFESGQKKLSFNLERIEGQYPNEFSSSRANKEQRPFLEIQTMTHEEVVANDKLNLSHLFPQATVTDDIDLPLVGELGSMITWESDKQEVISNDGKVNRPPAGKDEEVTLIATLQSGNVVDTFTIVLTVPESSRPAIKTYEVMPEADIFTHKGEVYEDYELVVGAERESYIRFDLSDVTGNIVETTLRLYNFHGHQPININISKINDNEWENNVLFDDLPEVGKVLTNFSTEGHGRFYNVDLTNIVKEELSNDKKISFHLSSDGSGKHFFSSRGKNAPEERNFEKGQEIALIVHTMTDRDQVNADRVWVEEEFNNKTVTSDLDLPDTGEWGSSITWTSHNEEVISNDGTVTRPSERDEDAEVRLTAEIKKGDIRETKDVIIHVPKLQPVSPFMKDSLKEVISLAKEEIDTVIIGTNPGEYPDSAIQKFTSAIENAENDLETETDLSMAVSRLIEAGTEFFNSVITSNKVIDDQNNLEYSEYRKELVQLVWEAKALRRVEPQLYTEASKVALDEQIEKAEEVLNGEYKHPFVRNREFYSPRPDEEIQFTIEYISRAPSYGMSTYGLKPAIQWYKSQYILNDAFSKYELTPSDDTFVHESNKGINFGSNDKAIIGGGRTAFLKFDLSDVPGNIQQASLYVSNAKNDNNFVHVHYIENDNWVENELTYNNAPQNEHGELDLGPVIGGWQLGGLNNRSSVPLTDITINEQQNDQVLSIALVNSPSANYPSEIYTKEYSDVDKHPVLSLTLDILEQDNVNEMYEHIVELASDLLENAETGSDIGQYPSHKVEKVHEKLEDLETLMNNGTTYELGVGFVQLYDAMREMRHSQILRSDVDSNSYLFFTEEELDEIRNKIDTNPVFKSEYEKLKEISDELTLEEIKGLKELLDSDYDQEKLNEKYSMWSPVNNQNFNIPENAAFANIEITLPSVENEENGLGHVWLDNLRIYSASGSDLDIKNASFEIGDSSPGHWETKTISGSPILKWEDRPNYAGHGEKSLYLENPTENDQGAWVYKHDIPVTPGDHTLTYQVKNDGIFNEGINIIISYKDKNGNPVGTPYINTNNHKSSFGPSNFNLAFQADALLYAVTKDKKYAEKAKERILWFLNDHLQGIESWLVNNERPYGYDAYGAVQTGRNAAVLASAYSLIKEADVFSEEEYELFIQQVNFMIRNLLDIRDRTELGIYEAQVNTGNWETDMAMGAALLGMALGDELPYARQWIDNGKLIVEGQLQYTLREDGAWPESIRYHFAILEKIGPFAKAIQNNIGEDWFAGESNLNKMFRFAVQVQTPPYEYFDNRISTPNFGDHVLGNGEEFSTLGQYYNEVALSDPELGAQMYQTWERAGKQFAEYWGESIAISNFFSPYNFENSNNDVLDLQSTDYASPWGMYLFRNHFDTEKETFMALIANEEEIGHHHNDQGSFILYANKVPLVMDPGIESYFDTSKRWFVSSNAHSVVQFKDGDYRDTPRTSKQEEFYTSDSLDYARISINHPSGADKGIHKRNIAYLKNGIEAFVIWDQINYAESSTRFNLPVAATDTTINGNIAESIGHFHMDLQTTFLQPANASITQEFARSHNQIPAIDGSHQLNYLRVEAEDSANYLTVLKPKEKGETGFTNKELFNNENIQIYQMTDEDDNWFIIAVNDSVDKQTVDIPISETVVDIKDNTIYETKNDQVQLTLDSNRLYIFVPESTHVDVDELNSLIQSADHLIDSAIIGQNPGEYDQSAVDELKDAVEKAKKLLNDSGITQEKVDQEIIDLKNAITIFENSANKEKDIDDEQLIETINQAKKRIKESKVGDNPGEYPQSAVDHLQRVILKARNLLTGDNRSQEDIDQMVEELKMAITIFDQSVNQLENNIISIQIGKKVKVEAGQTVIIEGTKSKIILPEDLPKGTILLVEKVNNLPEKLELAGDVFNFKFIYPDEVDYSGTFILSLGYDNEQYDAAEVGIFSFNKEIGVWELAEGKVDEDLITLKTSDSITTAYGVFVELKEKAEDEKKGIEDSEQKREDDDVISDPQIDENKLPKTATNSFNWLLLGFIIFIIGTVLWGLKKTNYLRE